MSSLDHEYNNFSLIQFLLSNIMTLVLSILTIQHCILSHFMIETVRILSLFNIFPDSMYFFPIGTSVWRCSWLQLAVEFLTLFMVIWIFFSNDVCSMVILTLRLLFHVNPFYFRLSLGSPQLLWEIFSLLIGFDAAPFYFSRRGTRPTPYNSTFTDINLERSPNFKSQVSHICIVFHFRISCILTVTHS